VGDVRGILTLSRLSSVQVGGVGKSLLPKFRVHSKWVTVVQDSSTELKTREGQEDRRVKEYRMVEGPFLTLGFIPPLGFDLTEGQDHFYTLLSRSPNPHASYRADWGAVLRLGGKTLIPPLHFSARASLFEIYMYRLEFKSASICKTLIPHL